MSLNLLAVQDQIVVKLNELSQDVYETSVPDEKKLRFDANGVLLPYIVVEFSDMEPGGNIGGILSSKYDVMSSSIVVSCVGPSERSVRQVAGLVRDKLIGYTPTDAGELRPAGGISYTNSDQKVNRYVSELGFIFAVNTIW
jgi:hypothetical protein